MFPFVLLVTLSLALPTGCKKKVASHEENPQAISLNLHTEPPTLDPRKAIDTSSIAIIGMCFEGLMKRGKNGSIIPAIAHKVKASKDNTVYTFYLRDANWWDGKKITASDFESTWRTILDPQFPSGFANDLYIIKNGWGVKNGKLPTSKLGIRSIDETTLEVELEYAPPYFLDFVASHSFFAVPAHIAPLDSKWARDAGPQLVGNGVYKLKKWKHHNCIVLEKNPLYWDSDAVTLNQIELTIIEDPNTELHMFESGEIDWAGYPLSTLPTDAIQTLENDQHFNRHPISGVYYYIFNTQEPPFNNLKMRRSFALAINRKAIIENIAQSDQKLATSFIPPTIWEVHSHFKDNDLELARKLFDEALSELGYTKSSLPKITLIYNTSEAHHKIAQTIQEQWQQAFGIQINLTNIEWRVFLDQLSHKQFQIARMGGVAGFNDPMAFFDLYRYPDSCNNYSGWSNASFTELINQSERMADVKKREALLRKAEEVLMTEMPIAPIYYYQGAYLKKHHLKGAQLSKFNEVDFKFAFLKTP